MPSPLSKRAALSCMILSAALTAGIGCNSRGQYSGLGGLFDDLMPPSPREAASRAFNPYDADLRRDSVTLLSNAPFGGESPYLRTYRLLVSDGDPTVRAACVAALGKHGTVEDVPLILIYLKDEARLVRWEAAKSLQRIHHSDAIDPLVDVLSKDTSGDVRLASACALGQYPRRKVFDALVGALNDDDYGVVIEANKSLQSITGQEFSAFGSIWLDWAKDRNNLFDDAQPFRYVEYEGPPSLWQRMKFWEDYERTIEQEPRGLEEEI